MNKPTNEPMSMPIDSSRAQARAIRRRRLTVGFCLALLLFPGFGCKQESNPRNVVLIVLDTLRANRLSAYGNPRPTSPVIDELARKGVLFETVVSNAPWTLPAMVGLLSGQYVTAESYNRGLRKSMVEQLNEAGWHTAAFTEGGFVSRYFGFDRGFDLFFAHKGTPDLMVSAAAADSGAEKFVGIERTFAWARAWLKQKMKEPFFLLVHTYESHTPYRRPIYTEGMEAGRYGESFELDDALAARMAGRDLSREEIDYVRALYDGGVTVADRHVGQLLDTLAALDLADDTLIVLTSDHGEDLADRQPHWPGNHGHALYDEQILVPLIIYDPTRDYPVQRVENQVRTVDIMPTLFEMIGLPQDPESHGRSLIPAMSGEESEDRLAWTRIPKGEHFPNLAHGLRTGRYKLIVRPDGSEDPKLELYDLENDRDETSNLAARDPELANQLRGQIEEIRSGLRRRGEADLREKGAKPDAALEERLRSLGYVQ